MKSLLSSVVLVIAAVLPLHAFNVDPASFSLTLKKGEKKQVVVRIKNVQEFPVVSSAAVSGVSVIKVYPPKLKLNAGAFTYTNIDIKVPENTTGSLDETVTFYVSGSGKNEKFRKIIAIPVHINIKPNDKAIPPK